MDRQSFMLGPNLHICHVTIIHLHKKLLRIAESSSLYAYGFVQYHMIRATVCLDGFTVIIQFVVYIRILIYKIVYTPNLKLTKENRHNDLQIPINTIKATTTAWHYITLTSLRYYIEH